MRNDFWARVRRLFGKGRPVPGLELVLADWDAEERSGKSRPVPRRELLHPLKGWREEVRSGTANDTLILRKGRQLPSWPVGR